MSLITMENGLQYQDEVTGTGAIAGEKATAVKVHYTGWLKKPDGSPGEKIDCSRERNDPLVFPLGAGYVIPGWDKGIQGMREGGRRILHIPSGLAYGKKGVSGIIPPDADLIFDVELLELIP